MDIQSYLQKLLDLLLLENYEIETIDDEKNITFKIKLSPEDSGIIIGRHGEGLIALQRILRASFGETIVDKKIIININDYRDQREEKIKELVERSAAKLVNTGEKSQLFRLNATERFFVHQLISEEKKYSNLTSHSVDDERGERILIIDYKSKEE